MSDVMAEALEPLLENYVRSRLPNDRLVRVEEFARIPGGASRETYLPYHRRLLDGREQAQPPAAFGSWKYPIELPGSPDRRVTRRQAVSVFVARLPGA